MYMVSMPATKRQVPRIYVQSRSNDRLISGPPNKRVRMMPPKCVCALACSSSADGNAKSVAAAERAAFLLTVVVSLCLAEVEVSCIAFISIYCFKKFNMLYP